MSDRPQEQIHQGRKLILLNEPVSECARDWPRIKNNWRISLNNQMNQVIAVAEHKGHDRMRSGLRFLFLQGPHGPFFGQLATHLRAAGNEVLRVGFNKGDEVSWPDCLPYLPYRGIAVDWPQALRRVVVDNGISDIVIYGDGRPVHAAARALAAELGLPIHCFEEGYLRPYWVNYERGGTNGNSPLMDLSLDQICAQVTGKAGELRPAPAHWGSIWWHSWHGAIYHGQILFRNADYPNYQSHREASIASEFALQSRRLALLPWSLFRRKLATRRLLRSGTSYHLALLQLGHDSSVADHSSFASMREFVSTCISAFARGAADNEWLVFMAHPLEDGRENLRRAVKVLSRHYGLVGRVVYLDGGHLGPLLDGAKSVVTINSTAGQQALWRGLPIKSLGRAVYGKPELASQQPLVDFFRNPLGPDSPAYREFRLFLLSTSQVAGNFYLARGRAGIVRKVMAMILADDDPYQEFAKQISVTKTSLRLVANRGKHEHA